MQKFKHGSNTYTTAAIKYKSEECKFVSHWGNFTAKYVIKYIYIIHVVRLIWKKKIKSFLILGRQFDKKEETKCHSRPDRWLLSNTNVRSVECLFEVLTSVIKICRALHLVYKTQVRKDVRLHNTVVVTGIVLLWKIDTYLFCHLHKWYNFSAALLKYSTSRKHAYIILTPLNPTCI